MKKTSTFLLIVTIFQIIKSEEDEINIIMKKKETAIQSQVTETSDTKIEKITKVFSDTIIKGNVNAEEIITDKININGEGTIKGEYLTNELETNTLKVNTVYTNKISGLKGFIQLNGDLIINGPEENIEENSQNLIFTNPPQQINNLLLKNEYYKVNGIKQWSLISYDDFSSSENIKDWSFQKLMSCNDNNGNLFIGGYCLLSKEEVSKKFFIGYSHESIRVKASYHMFDNWNGEMGYMKINDQIVWAKEGKSNEKNGINICGGDYNDPYFNLVIDVTIPHNESDVTITFGSTLDKDPCDASYGFQDVMLYIK